MNTSSPPIQPVDLSVDHAIGIMTGKAHLSVRTVPHQKILSDGINGLNVGIMTTGAFNITSDQLYGMLGIGGYSLRDQAGHQIRRIFDRQHQAKRVRTAEVGTKHVHIVHRARHGKLAGNNGLPNGDGTIVTAQAKTAGFAQRGLRVAFLFVSWTGVGCIALAGERLVP